MPGMDPAFPGLVIASYGRHALIALADGRICQGIPRGRNMVLACGDRVAIGHAGVGECVVERVAERTTLLYRSDSHREKVFAANATQVMLVTATEPVAHPELLHRCLIAATAAGLPVIVVLNKVDLSDRLPAARALLEPLRKLGIDVIEASAQDDSLPFRERLFGHCTVMLGQSGVGKSSLINRLCPGARANTDRISRALGTGKHTTTATRLYRVDDDGSVIDSPGVQVFGIGHLSVSQLENALVEFRPLLGQCRFRDCRHRDEPGCAVQAAAAVGAIDSARVVLFHKLCDESADAVRARRGH